jgi:hypothetical protein
MLTDLMFECNIPNGDINVITCTDDSDTGDNLYTHFTLADDCPVTLQHLRMKATELLYGQKAIQYHYCGSWKLQDLNLFSCDYENEYILVEKWEQII